ncbi:MAG: hypothetical protein A3G75_14095 [Verrucomicrobia bacterium RIFCSPLOWO2_12_FULL_64_8]|nr:MAG: hypothetical protein A3G75_14095 [Verrucomicrobia bacterium RIFCSPLOWO2_12_FULL_64_8]
MLTGLLGFPGAAWADSAAGTPDIQTVRACRYVPGVSVPAKMPADLANPAKPEAPPGRQPPAVTKVSAEKPPSSCAFWRD